MDPWEVALSALAAMIAFQTLVWAISVGAKNVSIVDVAWGPSFLVGALVAYANGAAPDGRRVMVLAMVAIWALRLSWHIGRRNIGKPEDHRYAAWREKYGPQRYWWFSLFQVFWLQAVLAWIVAVPVFAAMTSPTPSFPFVLDVLGLIVWAAGFGWEVVGDAQLARFKADPDSRGKVMDQGLWGWTRHPNYFGEAVLWYGFGFVALWTQWWWAALVGPGVVTFLLLRVSGVAMLDRTMPSRRPGYAEYMQRVPAFWPRRPAQSPPGSPST
jgi:steroid 5-alpha reductase family enzyme